jgi:hypothetical protein
MEKNPFKLRFEDAGKWGWANLATPQHWKLHLKHILTSIFVLTAVLGLVLMCVLQ